MPGVKSSIVIPGKHEETYILKTLFSFAVQVDLSGNPLDPDRFEIWFWPIIVLTIM
ncbi:hypothetical protein OKW96_18935 [Sphingobacterium sp. KU25419]|nr:hypothetical protein OKW96_18935 [Sphingobacterium sp. KU25419]